MTRYVWIFTNSYYNWLWKGLARGLETSLGLKAVIFAGTEQDKGFYEHQPPTDYACHVEVPCNPYNVVLAGRHPTRDEAEVVAYLRAFEREHDFSVAREMLLPDRHVGRGYYFGATGSPRSKTSIATTLAGAQAACAVQIEYWREQFKSMPPALVISYAGGGGIRFKPVSVLCRHLGVPMRILVSGRIRDLMYWADDEYHYSERLAKIFGRSFSVEEGIVAPKVVAPSLPNQLANNPKSQKRRRIADSLFRTTLLAGHVIAGRIYNRLRGYEKSRTGYFALSMVAQLFRGWSQRRLLRRLTVPTLPEGRRIVYFPLHVEPEASTLVLSPDNTNQLGIALDLALALPADTVLVVKEHPFQIGRRATDLYRALAEIPNVVFLEPEYPSIEVISRADLVCTITGSVGYEAAAMGKQVVFFWHKTILSGLPQVALMPRGVEPERLVALLDRASTADPVTGKIAGAVFLARAIANFNDFGHYDIHGRAAPPNDAELAEIIAGLRVGLAQ